MTILYVCNFVILFSIIVFYYPGSLVWQIICSDTTNEPSKSNLVNVSTQKLNATKNKIQHQQFCYSKSLQCFVFVLKITLSFHSTRHLLPLPPHFHPLSPTEILDIPKSTIHRYNKFLICWFVFFFSTLYSVVVVIKLMLPKGIHFNLMYFILRLYAHMFTCFGAQLHIHWFRNNVSRCCCFFLALNTGRLCVRIRHFVSAYFCYFLVIQYLLVVARVLWSFYLDQLQLSQLESRANVDFGESLTDTNIDRGEQIPIFFIFFQPV